MSYDFRKAISMNIDAKPLDGEHLLTEILGGLIEEYTLSLLAAPSFSGKSWVAMAIARSVNEPEYDFIGFRTTVERPVLYLDKEMGIRQFKDRWNRLSGEWQPKSTFFYADVTADQFSLSNRQCVEDLVKFVKQNKIEFVVIDSLGACSGGIDENSNGLMLMLLDNLKLLRAECAVLLVHHTGKMVKMDDLDSHALRGASAIRDQADNVFFINTFKGVERALRENKRRHKRGIVEDYAFNMNFTEDRVSFERITGSAPISVGHEDVLNVLKGSTKPYTAAGLKKALRVAKVSVNNNDFNPMLERMQKANLITIDATGGSWKISAKVEAGND